MSKFLKHYFRAGPLASLSVSRGDEPVPDNRDRLDAYHSCIQRPLYNAYPWPHLAVRKVTVALDRIASTTIGVHE